MTFKLIEYVPGTKITEPGAYVGMPIDVYHGLPTETPSISSSGLRRIFGNSPAHYWNTSPLNPDREEEKPSPPMILGRAAHHLLLGERDFNELFVRRPDKAPDGRDWSGNNLTCKKWMAEQALAGLTVITSEQMTQIEGMAAALAADEIVQGGILNGLIEISLFWQDEETGIWLKSRPDAIPNDSGDFSDLKCTGDVSDGAIERGLDDHGYYQQGAMVGEAARHVLKMEMQHFTLVYAEAKRPHCIRMDEVAPDEIAEGAEDNRLALRLFKRGLETGIWPGPKNRQGDGGFIRRTPYARKRAADRRAIIEQELAQ